MVKSSPSLLAGHRTQAAIPAARKVSPTADTLIVPISGGRQPGT